MIHEFDTLIEVDTPLGRGRAIFLESADHDYFWTVVLNETRAIVTFQQKQILATRNYTYQWGFTDEDMKNILASLKKTDSL
jgi:hypothetical protein